MKRLLILLALSLLLTGCTAAPREPHHSTPVLMGDTVPCTSCEEDVVPVNGCCPICGALLQ